MTPHKETEHTSKPITKSQFLPPLQRRIFLYLAKNNPQDINETTKALKGHYKSSWNAFNSLEKKGIVKKVSVKNYRGNVYPCFWLTIPGVFIALVEGANPTILLQKTLIIYSENKALQCLLEISPILGTEAPNVAYLAVLGKGKLESNDVTMMMATQMQKELTVQQVKQVIAIMKKYPEQFANVKIQMDQFRKNLDKLDLMMKEQ